MYDNHIDHAAVMAAHERHRAVQMRLPAAQERLDAAETEYAAASGRHETALRGDGGDPAKTASALEAASRAVTLATDAIPAVQRAIQESTALLGGEVQAAHASARAAAARDLVQAAHDIDGLKAALADALARYRKAAIALPSLGGEPVNAKPPHVPEEAIIWPTLPNRNVLPIVARHSPDHAATLKEGVA